jgi:hypothetical protein|nr:MAG TPA: hypothetical protein [Caudoviricetes sp.]
MQGNYMIVDFNGTTCKRNKNRWKTNLQGFNDKHFEITVCGTPIE